MMNLSVGMCHAACDADAPGKRSRYLIAELHKPARGTAGSGHSASVCCQVHSREQHLNIMGLIHSRRSPLGSRMPKVRVYPASTGSPNLLP